MNVPTPVTGWHDVSGPVLAISTGKGSLGPQRRRSGPETAPVPRMGLTLDEAAASLGMSRDSLEKHVLPSLRIVRRGRHRIVPVAELERWLIESAETALPTMRV